MSKREADGKGKREDTLAVQIKEWAEAIGLAAVVLVVLYFIFWPMKIDGMSMEDNYHSGDRIAVSRLLKYATEIERGEVIVCRITDEIKNKEIRVIKRVIGLPGDHVRITDGEVYINDELLKETYIKNDYTYGEAELTLDQDSYFVMGDNRGVSYDSRNVGPIHQKQVVGKVIMTIYRQ